MTKKVLRLSLLALFALASCSSPSTESSNDSVVPVPPSIQETPTESKEPEVFYDDQIALREKEFNSLVTLTSTSLNETPLTSFYKVYVGQDYYTFESYENFDTIMPLSSMYYINKENKAYKRQLTPNNEVVDTDAKKNYDESFFGYNNLDKFDIVADEVGEYDALPFLDETMHFNGLLTAGLTGTLTPKEAKFSFDGAEFIYETAYESNGITLNIHAKFKSKDQEQVKKLETLQNDERNHSIAEKIDELKNNNYTVEVKDVNETTVKTLFVNKDKTYIREASNNLGYVKTETGFDEVSVTEDETKVVLNNNSEEAYESLLAKFNISKDVFYPEEGKFKPYLFIQNIAEEFITIGLEEFVFDNLTLQVDETSLTLNCLSTMNKQYTVSFKDIGNTQIPVDLSQYGKKTSWNDENSEVITALETFFGSICPLLYMDTGYGWNYCDLSEGEYLEIISEDVPESETPLLKAQYAKLLEENNYRKMTPSETETLGFVYALEEDQQVYDLGNGFAVEVYDGFVDSFVMGLGLYIQPII